MSGTRGAVLDELEFRVLGPLEVVRKGRLLSVAGERQRALLAILVLHANEVVSADLLLEEVFGDATPATAQNTLQAAVWRLRKTLGTPDAVLTRPRGYVLQVEPARVDLRRFEQLVEEGGRALERGEAEVAASLLASALALWRGPPLADVDIGSGAAADVARLHERRLTALMDRIDADLALGRSSQLVGELEALAREHPYQERLRGQLMLALYRSGRQAEALEVYTETRKLLVEALGIEPSRSLQRLERAILRQEASLDGPRADAPVGRANRFPPPADVTLPPAGQPRRQHRWEDRRLADLDWRRAAAVAAVGIVLAAAIAAGAIALDGGSASRAVIGSNAVGLIDAGSNRLLAHVDVGASPTRIVAGGDAIWVLNSADSTISRLDPRTHRVRTIGVPETATDLAIGGDAVWVLSVAHAAAPDPFAGEAILARVDPRFVHILETRRVGAPGSNTFDDGVAAGGRSVWTSEPGVLTHFDARTVRVLGRVSGVQNVGRLVADRDSAWAITHDGVVHVRDGARSTNDLRLGGNPTAIALADGAVWVATGPTSVCCPERTTRATVTRIDTASEAPSLTLSVPGSPVGVAARGRTAWVATSDGRIVRIERDRVTSTTRVAERLGGIAVDRNGVWFTVPHA